MHTVYIVDDDKPVIDSFWLRRGLFRECGFEICGAETTPQAAFDEIRKLRPDVVISDLKMPGMTGIELLERLQDELLPPLFVIISAYNDYKDVRKLFKNTSGFDYLVKPVTDAYLRELLCALASKLDYNNPEPEHNSGSRKLDEIMRYIGEHFTMEHTLPALSERFGVTETYICNLFSKNLNTTFSGYVNSIRMERAESLLKTTNLRVKDISIKCGYANPFYFTRLFTKEHGGTSPTEYRNASHEE